MDAMSTDSNAGSEGAHKIGHTTTRMSRAEILAPMDRRRTWTPEQKREIVSESLGSDLTVMEVARKHRINTGQIYTWRQQLLDVASSVIAHAPPRFASVEVTSSAQTKIDPPVPEGCAPASPSLPRPEGLIEIQLPGGVLLRVDAQVDGRALRRVLGALENR